jgi:hypothetical protein
VNPATTMREEVGIEAPRWSTDGKSACAPLKTLKLDQITTPYTSFNNEPTRVLRRSRLVLHNRVMHVHIVGVKRESISTIPN